MLVSSSPCWTSLIGGGAAVWLWSRFCGGGGLRGGARLLAACWHSVCEVLPGADLGGPVRGTGRLRVFLAAVVVRVLGSVLLAAVAGVVMGAVGRGALPASYCYALAPAMAACTLIGLAGPGWP